MTATIHVSVAAPFFLVSFLDPDTKEPVCACPRGTLKRVTERAAEMGWSCYAGVEYEVGLLSALLSTSLQSYPVFQL
jgi:glutamine synthetase